MKVVMASNNAHKIAELRAILSAYGLDVVSCRDAAGAASARAEGGHRTISRYGAADVGWTELTHQEKNAAALILPPNVDGSLRTDLAPWAEILAGADSELVFSGGGRKTAFLLTEEERAVLLSATRRYVTGCKNALPVPVTLPSAP